MRAAIAYIKFPTMLERYKILRHPCEHIAVVVHIEASKMGVILQMAFLILFDWNKTLHVQIHLKIQLTNILHLLNVLAPNRRQAIT